MRRSLDAAEARDGGRDTGVIEEVVPEPPTGEVARVLVASKPPLVAQVTRQSVEALGLVPGARVFAAFKATGVTVVS